MSSENNPLVSFVIACYNTPLYIKDAIDSALNQTYKNIEIIVVDDGSDADTKTVLTKIESKITKLITQKNQGQSVARNNGIKIASGDYIVILDSDDFFEPLFVEKAIAAIDTSISLVTCWANCFSKNESRKFIPKGGELEQFLFENASLSSSLFKKTDWHLCGGYDETMRSGWEDWEFFIRLMALGGSCFVIPELLFNYRRLENSTTSRANKQIPNLLRYIMKKNKALYISNFEMTIDFFTQYLQRERKEREKIFTKPEYKVGKIIIAPIRVIKNKLIGN